MCEHMAKTPQKQNDRTAALIEPRCFLRSLSRSLQEAVFACKRNSVRGWLLCCRGRLSCAYVLQNRMDQRDSFGLLGCRRTMVCEPLAQSDPNPPSLAMSAKRIVSV